MKVVAVMHEISRGVVTYEEEITVEINQATKFTDLLSELGSSIVDLNVFAVSVSTSVDNVVSICLDEVNHIVLFIGRESIDRWQGPDGKDWFMDECFQESSEVPYTEIVFDYVTKRAKQIDAQVRRIV